MVGLDTMIYNIICNTTKKFTFQYGWIRYPSERIAEWLAEHKFTFQYGWIRYAYKPLRYQALIFIYIPIWLD